MSKILLLLVFVSCFLSTSWCQSGQRVAKTTAGPATKTPVPVKKTSPANVPPDVLFATNEDCDLYINNDRKGDLLKSNFFYLKLTPGRYHYKAISKSTKDELVDSFRVRDAGANEVFIDLLYWVDERTAERARLNVPKAAAEVVNRIDKIGDQQPEVGKLSLKDAEVLVINSLLGNMAEIKGGNFVMGNSKSPIRDEVEHPVTVSSLFFSKYEVTQHQWETIMGNNPSINKGCPTCPVDNVSWEEVMRFIRKLNVMSGRKFRLPTEAEWEYVYKIGGKTEIEQAGGQEAYIKKTGWYFSNAAKKTHPVGILQPNVAGIFDLTGNVSEWCLDWYGINYYKEEFNQLNPEGPPLGKQKVIRGGNYKDFSGDRFRPSFRNKKSPVEKGSETGFRLVMDISN